MDPGAPTDATATAAAVNRFGADLYDALAATPSPPPNLVFSPASVAIALSMVLTGARGSTAEQLAGALHLDEGSPAHASLAVLAAALRRSDDPDVVLAIVNSLWVQRGFPIEPAFESVLLSGFGTAPETVDFRVDAEAARGRINAWVDTATRHRIPELLGAGAVTAETTLTLVNAVYVKAPWLWPFTSTATAPAIFATPAGNVHVPTMHRVGHLAYARSADFEAIELPYAGGSISMLIVLPAPGLPLSTAVAALALGRIEGVRTKVSLSVPRFEIETSADLGRLLVAMGITDAFDAERADFTGIAVAEPPLFVSGVIHQANITVDEPGTEAAAATAVMVAGGAAASQDKPVEVHVDRPFAFAVREVATGAVLFLGHVNDPTKAG